MTIGQNAGVQQVLIPGHLRSWWREIRAMRAVFSWHRPCSPGTCCEDKTFQIFRLSTFLPIHLSVKKTVFHFRSVQFAVHWIRWRKVWIKKGFAERCLASMNCFLSMYCVCSPSQSNTMPSKLDSMHDFHVQYIYFNLIHLFQFNTFILIKYIYFNPTHSF